DLFVAGTPGRVLMIEANAKEMPENEMKGALKLAQEHLAQPLELIGKLVADIGKEKLDKTSLTAEADLTEEDLKEKAEVVEKARAFVADKLDAALFVGPGLSKSERRGKAHELKEQLDA